MKVYFCSAIGPESLATARQHGKRHECPKPSLAVPYLYSIGGAYGIYAVFGGL